MKNVYLHYYEKIIVTNILRLILTQIRTADKVHMVVLLTTAEL